MAGLALRRASEPPQKLLLLSLLAAIWLLPVVSPGSPTRIIPQPKCVSFCKEASKFALQPGTTYRYNYRTDLRTFASGASSQESRIQLTAIAEITAVTACEHQLELKDVKLLESHPSDRGSTASEIPNSAALVLELTKSPVRFSFQDGKVEHLCGATEEHSWALNVKRGVLSLLQNTMDDLTRAQSLHESDINGKCLTRYESSSDASGREIKRSKNLKSCSQRQSHISAIQSVAYASSSPVQNIPLLSGNQECTQTIRNRMVHKVVCLEEHKFQPFERTSSGVSTAVSQSLSFESSRTSPSIKQDLGEFKKSGLLFDTSAAQDSDDGNIQEIQEILETLVRESVPKVSVLVPEQFIDLVAQLRTVNYAVISTLFNKASSEVARTFLLDALPLVGTAPSLTFMREMFVEGKLTELQIDSWLTSIAFIKHPRLEMIPAIAPMLDGEPRNQALLAIASVVHGYCKDHDTCAQESPVQDALRKILGFLGTSCKLGKYGNRELTRAIFALKAIGNAGRLPAENDDRSFQLLRKCVEEETNPIEARLAALDAFRRIPCDHYEQHPLIDIYKNMKEQTEIRIMAYLVSMKCPNRELIEAVKDTLYTDAVNQVGSFVWTHLTNLQETSSPDKQTLKDLLSNDFLKNKFNTDARKFSRNYESSTFWEDANVGGGIDANVIFTPDSFLPRSTTLNLTLHLFGESINMLEVGGRIHSFEQVLESIFGPQGYFPEPHVNEALNAVRSKRDTSNNPVERLGQVFNQAGVNRDRLPGGSGFLRVFGNEISYKHFEFSHKHTAPTLVDENGRNWLDITYLFDNMGTGKSTDFTKSSVLMDSRYNVPTGAGIPLSLGVQAAATIGMKASGKIDLSNFWEDQQVDIHGSLQPSGAIQMDGHLTLQIGPSNSKLKSGIKFQNTLHTATAVQVRVLIKGSSEVHTSLTLPQDKQEILEVKSQLILISPSGRADEVVGGHSSDHAKAQVCSPELVSTIVGLKFCGSATIPDEIGFPLLNPAAVAVTVEKTDTFNSYEFDYKWLGDENGSKQDISLLFNTPGSRIDRRVAIAYSMDTIQGKMEASIETPRKSLMAQGQYSKTAQNLQLTLRSAEEQILMVSTGLRKQATRMEPHLLVSYYGRPLIDLQGIMYLANILDSDGKANFDFTLKHLTDSPIQLTGEMTRLRDMYDGRLGIDSSVATGNIRTQVRLRPDLVTSKAEIQYSWRAGEQRQLNFGGKLSKLEKGALVKYTAVATVSSPQLSHLNSDFSWEIAMGRGYCENNLKLALGKSKWEGKTLYKNQFRRQLQDTQLLFSLAAPQNGVDYFLNLQHQKNQSGIFTRFTARSDPQNEVRALAEYLRTNEKLLRRNLNAEISWPASIYSLKSGVTEIRTGEFEAELVLSPNTGKQKKATVSYKNGSTKRRQDHVLEVRAENFLAVPVKYSGKMLASDRESLMTTQLHIEGNARYSGRWGGSFEYSASKRFAHKMEAKVDLNGANYSADLNWRQARSGDQTYTADIRLSQHLYSELLLRKGDGRDSFWGMLTVIPDKSFRPQEKAVFEGKLSAESVKAEIDYFGQTMGLIGHYSSNKIQLEAELDSRRIAFSLETPSFTLEKLKLVANLETPMDGYSNFGLTIDHVYTGNTLNSRVDTHLEGKTAAVAVYGNLDTPESTFSIMVEATGIDKVVAVAKMSESGASKWLEITAQKGSQESVLKVEVTNMQRSNNLKVDFNGCSFIPEVSFEYNRQKTSEVTDNFNLRWTPQGSPSQTIEGRVSYLLSPFKVSFLLTSPWKSLERLEGRFSIFESDLNKEMKLYANGPFSAFPLNLEIKCGGTNDEFAHSLLASWYTKGSRLQSSVQLSSTGRLKSLDDGEFKISARIPNHRYDLEMLSTRSKDAGLCIESKMAYNDEIMEVGLLWLVESVERVQTSLWAIVPNRPKMTISFEHFRRSDSYLFDFSAGLVGQAMNTMKIDAKHDGWRKWDMRASLASPWNFLPNIDVSSSHDFTDVSSLRHTTEYNVREISEYWGGYDDQTGKLVLSVEDGKVDMYGFHYDTEYFHVVGELDLKKVHLKAKATTQLAPNFDVTFGVEKFPFGGSMAYVDLNENGTRLCHWAINAYGEDADAYGGKIHLHCPQEDFEIKAEAKLDWSKGLLEFELQDLAKDLIQLKFKSEVGGNEGLLEFNVDGKGHALFAKKTVEAKYSATSEKVEIGAQYEDTKGKISISGLGEYTSARKKLDLRVNGNQVLAYRLEILENRRLEGVATRSGQKLFAVTAEYDMEPGEYALGKHTLKVAVATEKTYSYQAVLGLDLDKILIQLDTPFQNYKTVVLQGEFKLQGSDNSATLTVRRMDSIYNLKLKSHSSSTGRAGSVGSVSVEVETPWPGYQKIEYSLGYERSRNALKGTFEGSIDNSRTTLRLTYSAGNAEVHLSTPHRDFRKILVSTQWTLSDTTNSFQATTSFNERSHLLRLNWLLDPTNGFGQITLGGAEAGTAEFKYDLRQGYNIDASLDFSGKTYQIGGKLVIDPQEFRVQIHTPFSGVQNLGAKGIYTQPTPRGHKFAFVWNLNGEEERVTGEASMTDQSVEFTLETPLREPWNLVQGSIALEGMLSDKTLKVQLKRGGKEDFHLKAHLASNGHIFQNEANSEVNFKLDLQSSILGWEEFVLDSNYKRIGNNHRIGLGFSKRVEILKSDIYFSLPKSKGQEMTFQGSLSIPQIKLTTGVDLSMKIDLSDETSIKAKLSNNGVDYSCEGSFQVNSDKFKVEASSSFAPLRTFAASGSYERLSNTALSVQLNEKVIDIKLQGSYERFKQFKVNCDITTPFEGYRTLHGEAHLTLQDKLGTGSFKIQNDRVRYMGKLEGRLDSDAGEIRIQFNSPLYKLENVVWSVKFGDSKAIIRLERNTKEDVKIETSLKNGQLVLGIISNIPAYPINTRSLIDWSQSPLSAQLHFDGGLNNQVVSVVCNIQGSKDGNIEVHTPLKGYESLKLQWLLDGTLANGNAKLSYDLPIYGKRAFRSSWKQDNYKSLEAEMWANENESVDRGVSLQYSLATLNSGLDKFSASVSYIGEKAPQALKLSLSVKSEKDGASLIDFSLKTPFSPMEDLSLSGKVMMSRELSIDLTSTLNRQPALTLSSTFVAQPLMSKLKLIFNAPAISEPFNLNGIYDLRTNDKHVELFFAQNKYKLNVKAQAIVSQDNPQEIELRMNVDSNIPSVTVSASASLRAGYKIESDGTRQVTISVDSLQTGNWRGLASIRPRADFNVQIRLDSPIQDVVPSVKSELGWTRTGETLTGDFSFQMTPHDIHSRVTLSADEIKMTLTSGYPGLDNVLLQGKFESGAGTVNKKLSVDIRVAGKEITLTSNVLIPTKGRSLESSIRLVSSWDVIPAALLEASLDESGVLSIHGNFGQRSIDVNGNFKRKPGKSVWEAAESDMTLSVDSAELLTIQSHHLFFQNQYSWNMTVGSEFSLNSFLEQVRDRSVFSGHLKWPTVQEGVKLAGETNKGRFRTTMQSPWTSEIELSGRFKVEDDEYSADAFVTYEGVKSGLRGELLAKEDAIAARMNVDVPVLGQKVDAKIHLQLADKNNVVGVVEMSMGDRRLSVKGSLSTSHYTSSQYGPMVEQVFKTSLSLPRSDYVKVSTDWTLRRPLDGWHHAEIEGSLTLPKETHNGAFRYDIPTSGSSGKVGADWYLNCKLLSSEVLKGSFEAEKFRLDDFSGGFKYRENEFKATWVLAKNFLFDISANVPNLLQEASPLRVQAEGIFDPAQEFSVRSTFSANRDSSTIEGGLIRNRDGFNIRFTSKVPALQSQQLDIGLKVTDVGRGRTVLDLSGSYGQESFAAIGELISSATTLSASSKVSGSYGAHFLQLGSVKKGNGHFLEISVESQNLFNSKRVHVTGKLTPSPNGFTSSIECRTKEAVHELTVNMIFEPQRGTVLIKFDSPVAEPILLQSNYVVNSDKAGLKLTVNMGDPHEFEVLLDRKAKEAKIILNCPLIHTGPILLHGRAQTGENQISFIGDLDMFSNRFRGEGTLRYENVRDIEIKFEIITPFKRFDRITVGGKLGNNVAEIEFHTPLADLPNFMVKSSGINLFEPNDFFNFHPKVTLGLPFVKYSAGASFQLASETVPGKFGVHFEQEFPNEDAERYDAYINVSPYERLRLDMDEPVQIKIEANTPIENVRHLEILVGGNVVWRRWGDLIVEAHFNDKKISLTSQLKNIEGHQQLNIVFVSPFKAYERFELLCNIENYEEIGAGHNIQLEFQRPGWGKPLSLEIDYRIRYNGLSDIDGEFKLAPQMIQMSPIFMRLRSEGKGPKYSGELEGTWGTYRPVLKIDASLTPEAFSGSIEGKMGEKSEYQFLTKVETLFEPKRFSVETEMTLNYNQLFLLSTGVVQEENAMEGQFRITTPFKIIRSASALYRLSPTKKVEITLENLMKNLDIAAGLSYNDRKLVHVELVNKNGRRILDIHNPFRPISLSIGYDLSSSYAYVVAEACWDLIKSSESTVGFKMGLNKAPQSLGPKGLTLKVHGGQYGFVELGVTHLNQENLFEQVVNLKWNQPAAHGAGESGYRVNWKSDSKLGIKTENFVLRLELPFRSVEVEAQKSWNGKEGSNGVLVRWDAASDPSKTAGYHLISSKSQAWRSSSTKNILTVIHPALVHDLTFTVDRRYTNLALQALSVVFQPNSNPTDALTLEFKRDSIRNRELRFGIFHPATNTDMTGHFKQVDSTRSLYLSHLALSGEKQVLNLEVTSDVHGTFIDASNEKNLLLKYEFKPSIDLPRLYIKTPSLELAGEYVNSPPLIKGAMKFDSGKELSVMAGLPHSKEITLKIARNNFGMNIRDFMVAFRLNASQILSTQIHWRPETSDEFRRLLVVDLPRWLNRIYSEDIPKALSSVNDEIEGRLTLINPNLNRIYSDLKDFSRDEVQMIVQEVKKAAEYLEKVHQKNTFHTRDLLKVVQNCANKLYNACSTSIQSIQETVSEITSAIRSGIDELTRLWKENGERLESVLMPLWDAAESKMIKIWEDQTANRWKFIRKLGETYEIVGQILDGNLEELEKTLKGLGIVRKLKKIYQDYCDWIRELPIQEYLDEAYEMFKELVWRPLQAYYKPYFDAWNSAMEEGNVIALLEMPPLPYARFLTNRILGLANRFWVFVEAEQKIKGLFRNILSRIDVLIQSHIPTASMVWDLDKGHIEYHQPLSVLEWNHFNELPKFKETEQDVEETHHIQDFYFDLLDTMRNTRPVMEMDMRDMLPPFESTAIIAGDHHFLTFDKSYYRFTGDCSYILASDLLHQNLTLLVNYENTGRAEPKKKSYSLITGSGRVEIDSESLQVTVNGQPSELPVTVGPTYLRRQRSGIELIDTRGFQMKCSQSPSVCRISVSGWYFGKIGGLLGNYDNEKSNDMRTPDGTVVADVANFAHSWRVGPRSGQCQMKNYADKAEVDDSLCGQMLNSTMSPLRPCFKTVDVEDFKRMCKYDVKNGKGEKEGRICTGIAAYVMQCQRQGIDIWMPPQCVKCKMEGSAQMKIGENMTYSPEHRRPPSSADVVFLIEEAADLRDYNLAETMKKLEAAFRAEGIENNRYAIIGFGGKGGRSKPHLRTSNSNVWSSMSTLKIHDPSVMDGPGRGDLYEAIDFAATIGYRAGVSKTIIAVVPGKGQCEDNVRYSDSLTLLLENDIRLHILTPEDFSLKLETKQDEANKIFGVDLDGAFTLRQLKRGPIESDKALRRQVKMPKDLCTPLAMETTGTLFNLKMLQRPAMAKKFVDVWSRRVASTSKPSDCQLCECLPDRDGGSMTLCHHCMSPNLQKFIDDLNKLENHPDPMDPVWLEDGVAMD